MTSVFIALAGGSLLFFVWQVLSLSRTEGPSTFLTRFLTSGGLLITGASVWAIHTAILPETLLFAALSLGLVTTALGMKKALQSFKTLTAQLSQREQQFNSAEDRFEEAEDQISDYRSRIEKSLETFKKREQELEATNQEVTQEYTKEKNFNATLNFIFRTRMQNFWGMMDLLRDTQLSSIQRKYMDTMRQEAGEITTFINAVADYALLKAKKAKLHPKPESLKGILKRLVKNASMQAYERQITLEERYDQLLPSAVKVDSSRLELVLSTLLKYCIANTSQGTVSLESEMIKRQGNTSHIEFRVVAPGRLMNLQQIQDIFKADFDPDSFTSSDEKVSESLSCMQLIVMRGIIELMGGQFQIKSAGDRETTISLSLVFENTVAQAGDAPEDEDVDAPILFKEKNIAVVTSDVSESSFIQTLLNPLGAGVICSLSLEDLKESVEASGAQMKDIDLLIIDPEVYHSHSKFRDALNIFYNKAGQVPSVMVSDVEPARLSASGFSISRFRYVLQKPLDKSYLLSKISYLLSETPRLPAVERIGPSLDMTLSSRYPMRILVAEDQKVNAMLIQSILNKLGYKADFVEDGDEAVKAARAGDYDLVFMDVVMPRKNGLLATREIREMLHMKEVPVIALTAKVSVEDRERCFNAGMNDYMSKPMRLEHFQQKIKQWGEKKMASGPLRSNIQTDEQAAALRVVNS